MPIEHYCLLLNPRTLPLCCIWQEKALRLPEKEAFAPSKFARAAPALDVMGLTSMQLKAAVGLRMSGQGGPRYPVIFRGGLRGNLRFEEARAVLQSTCADRTSARRLFLEKKPLSGSGFGVRQLENRCRGARSPRKAKSHGKPARGCSVLYSPQDLVLISCGGGARAIFSPFEPGNEPDRARSKRAFSEAVLAISMLPLTCVTPCQETDGSNWPSNMCDINHRLQAE